MKARILLPSLLLIWGCAPDGEGPERPPEGPAETSEILIQPVEAGSGAELRDPEVTVRYLARTPITLDVTGVEKVPSAEPYRIAAAVGEDSLVLELRLEAESYARLDTALAVARGGSAGPYRLAMTLLPEGTGAGGGRADPGPAASGEDRGAMLAGDRAFNAGDWRGAEGQYARMAPPGDRGGDYAREYQLALVRLGIARINQGDWAGAREALDEAVAFDFREYTAFFYLGQVQCVQGEYAQGRQSLNHIREWLPLHISEEQRPLVFALLDYQLGMCSYQEFTGARVQSDLDRSRRQTLSELGSFLQKAEALPEIPANIQAAMTHARAVMDELGGREPFPGP